MPASAREACSIDVEAVNLPSTLQYDATELSPLSSEQQYRLVNRGGSECSIRLSLQEGTTQSNIAIGPRGKLRIEWLDDESRPLTNDNGIGLGRRLAIPAGGATPLTIRLSVPMGQLVSRGNYRALTELQLVEVGAPNRTIIATLPLDVTILVLPVVALSFSGTDRGSSNARVDFGQLETGETRQVGFLALSNGGYRLGVQSENGGVLRHQRLDATIDYRLQIDGETVDLSGETNLDFDESNRRLARHRADITIGQVDGRPAGRYADTVTVRIRPWR
jgi:hypothetical protein